MYDYVNFQMPCPRCGCVLLAFQTKDAHCVMDTIDPDGIGQFYTSCRCGMWVEFNRPHPETPRRKTPATLEDVKALGFVITVREER